MTLGRVTLNDFDLGFHIKYILTPSEKTSLSLHAVKLRMV